MRAHIGGEATGRHSCRSQRTPLGAGEQCWGGRALKEKVYWEREKQSIAWHLSNDSFVIVTASLT